MKTLRLLMLIIAVGVLPLGFTGCPTSPNQRVVEVMTLKSVGQAAEQAVAASAQLYEQKKITAEQARTVLDTYNQKFQPAYRVAVNAAQSNLESIASPDLVNLATQLANLVSSYQNPKPL